MGRHREYGASIPPLAAPLPYALAAEATLPARDYLFVVDVVGHFTAQGAKNRLGRPLDARAEPASHVGRDHVGREQHLVAEVAQLAVERQRLLLEHVERGAADLSLEQGLDERRLLDAGAA